MKISAAIGQGFGVILTANRQIPSSFGLEEDPSDFSRAPGTRKLSGRMNNSRERFRLAEV